MKNTIAILSLACTFMAMLVLDVAYTETRANREEEIIVEYSYEDTIENDCSDVAPITVSVNGIALSEEEYEVACKLVQTEAGGESYLGKLAVAQTIKDRMESRGQSAMQVMTSPNQYCIYDVKVSDETRKAVYECFHFDVDAVSSPITHFYSGEARPYWATDECYVCTIGGHRFYGRV